MDLFLILEKKVIRSNHVMGAQMVNFNMNIGVVILLNSMLLLCKLILFHT